MDTREKQMLVLENGFEPRLIQLAFRTGLHLIVNDGDVEAVTASVLERLPVPVHP